MNKETGSSIILVAIFFALLALGAYLLLTCNTSVLDLYNSAGTLAQGL